MGMIVTVIGNTPKHRSYTVTNVDGPFQPTDKAPAATLRQGPFNTVHIVPDWVQRSEGIGPMFDGNFAYCNDSRFGKALETLTNEKSITHAAIALHDRIESQETYDIMCR